ncbi:MAG: hypothetical protein GXO29_01555 [Thermotogae bacterium]|nr:hypothetical protein [Thermotogota bacterium]
MLPLLAFVYMKHEAWASLAKFSYRYEDKSAVANIGGYVRAFRWGRYGVAFGGDFVVWFGYDVGPIQMDPIYADYYVWFGGFREMGKGVAYLLVEHPCFHYIDRLDTLPLYWNALRVAYRERDLEISVAQYIHSDRYQFLARGTDWSTDLKMFRRVRKPLGESIHLFADMRVFVAAGRDYRKIYGSLDIRVGIEFWSESGDLTLALGYRPYDRTGIIRDVEGVPFLSLSARGF